MPLHNKEDIKGYFGFTNSRGEWVYCKTCFDHLESQDDYLNDKTQILTEDELEQDERVFVCDQCHKLIR